MDRLLQPVLSRIIRRGTLRVTTALGKTFTVGDGTGERVSVRFTSQSVALAVLYDPDLKLGEAYMNGTLVIEEGSIADLLALALSQDGAGVSISPGASARARTTSLRANPAT
jgi:cyclopropane-fatty-acyl-phospholipid synthase